MADKLFHGHSDSGRTLYAAVLDAVGDWWNGTAFENYDGGSWDDYAIALSEYGNTAVYRSAVPGLAAGHYAIFIFEQQGASPAVGDPIASAGTLDWGGADIATLSSIITHGDAEWATVSAATISAAVLTTPANKLATDASGYVTLTAASVAAIATAVWAAATRTLTASTNITAGIAQAVWEYATRVLTAGTNLPTAASITDAVWAAASRTLTAFGFTVTETNSAAIKAVTDKLDTALEQDGVVYRLTTNALEQAPTGGDATEAKQDTIIADIAAIAAVDQDVIAEAVMDAVVDGAVDVRTALKNTNAIAANKIVKSGSDPIELDIYNAAGDTIIKTLEYEADGSERNPA